MHIISSDEDQDVVIDIYAGFTKQDDLIISCERSNYNDPRDNLTTAAIVKKHDARLIAKNHHIPYRDIPQLVHDAMNLYREIINPTPQQIIDCFKEITECLLDEGCRFRIIRTRADSNTLFR